MSLDTGSMVFGAGISCYVLTALCSIPVTQGTFRVRTALKDPLKDIWQDTKCPQKADDCPRLDFLEARAVRGLLQFIVTSAGILGTLLVAFSGRI